MKWRPKVHCLTGVGNSRTESLIPKRDASFINSELFITLGGQQQSSFDFETTPVKQQSPKRYVTVKDMSEQVYDGPLRPFNETGITVSHGVLDSEFWNPYSVHTIQHHAPPKPISQLEIEDASLEILKVFLKKDCLWKDEGNRLIAGPFNSSTHIREDRHFHNVIRYMQGLRR